MIPNKEQRKLHADCDIVFDKHIEKSEEHKDKIKRYFKEVLQGIIEPMYRFKIETRER